MTTKQLEAIRKHGENLLAIFPNAKPADPVALCKKLHRLEVQAHNGATRYCNGEKLFIGRETFDFHADGEAWKKFSTFILAKLNAILGAHSVPVFVNGDARGYALKIESDYLAEFRKGVRFGGPTAEEKLHSDWGGYGIIAPEINAK